MNAPYFIIDMQIWSQAFICLQRKLLRSKMVLKLVEAQDNYMPVIVQNHLTTIVLHFTIFLI